MEERRGACRVWVGNPKGRRPLGRPRHRWEHNIKMDLQKVGWGHELDRSGSEYGRVAGTCECGNEHSGSIKCVEFLDSLKTGLLLGKNCSMESVSYFVT